MPYHSSLSSRAPRGVTLTIGCIDQDLKRVSDGRVDEALIVVKLREDYSGLTVTHLVRFLKRYRKNISEQALIKRVHRALDRFAHKGLVKTEVIGSHRFAKLTEFGLKAIPEAVDLFQLIKVYQHTS